MVMKVTGWANVNEISLFTNKYEVKQSVPYTLGVPTYIDPKQGVNVARPLSRESG